MQRFEPRTRPLAAQLSADAGLWLLFGDGIALAAGRSFGVVGARLLVAAVWWLADVVHRVPRSDDRRAVMV